VENGCRGVAEKRKILATQNTMPIVISATYPHATNGSFDDLPARMLARVGEISLTDKEISAS
jgi:hypothetical protein